MPSCCDKPGNNRARYYALAAIVIAVVLLVALLAGCGTTRLTSANYDQIRDGMSRGEVAAISGEPAQMVGGQFMGGDGGGAMGREGDTAVLVQFMDDKVGGKQMTRGTATRLLGVGGDLLQ